MQQHSDAQAMAQYKQQVAPATCPHPAPLHALPAACHCAARTADMDVCVGTSRNQAKKILKRLSSLSSLPTEMSIESNEYVFQCVPL